MTIGGFSLGDLAIPAVFVIWLVMMRWVLPRSGVPT